MTTVGEHIQNTDSAICRNIASLADQRNLLSQNVLAQLRNLVEGVAVLLHLGSSDAEYSSSEESLKIFWTPETQQAVLKSLRHSNSPKDVALLSSRRGLTPVRPGP